MNNSLPKDRYIGRIYGEPSYRQALLTTKGKSINSMLGLFLVPSPKTQLVIKLYLFKHKIYIEDYSNALFQKFEKIKE